jgi:hypothetical protein
MRLVVAAGWRAAGDSAVRRSRLLQLCLAASNKAFFSLSFSPGLKTKAAAFSVPVDPARPSVCVSNMQRWRTGPPLHILVDVYVKATTPTQELLARPGEKSKEFTRLILWQLGAGLKLVRLFFSGWAKIEREREAPAGLYSSTQPP